MHRSVHHSRSRTQSSRASSSDAICGEDRTGERCGSARSAAVSVCALLCGLAGAVTLTAQPHPHAADRGEKRCAVCVLWRDTLTRDVCYVCVERRD
eukprot:3587629-Prymnesium_polylepis.2